MIGDFYTQELYIHSMMCVFLLRFVYIKIYSFSCINQNLGIVDIRYIVVCFTWMFVGYEGGHQHANRTFILLSNIMFFIFIVIS